MKLVGYIRVSTKTQVEDGLGREIQHDTIRDWAKANGHRIVHWAYDDGISGTKTLEERDGLADALAAITSHTAAGIVVYRLDRLARDLIVQETILAEIRRVGGAIHTTAASEAGYLTDDPDDPSRKMIRQVLGAVAEYERAMIALRLRRGRRMKASRGGYAYGAPPIGKQASDKQLIDHPGEQEAIARIVELHHAGRSTRQIAAALAAEQIPTKRGGPWQSAVISRVIQRSAG